MGYGWGVSKFRGGQRVVICVKLLLKEWDGGGTQFVNRGD
jgi:hypothetical protein